MWYVRFGGISFRSVLGCEFTLNNNRFNTLKFEARNKLFREMPSDQYGPDMHYLCVGL
jgi:hypothetical protein